MVINTSHLLSLGLTGILLAWGTRAGFAATPLPLLSGAAASAAESAERSQFVRSIDVFGTDQITAEQVQQQWGEQIVELSEAIYGSPEQMSQDLPVEIYETVVADIHTMGEFAHVELSMIVYFEPEQDNTVHVTVDVVEVADAAARMPFYPAPTQPLPDPAGLIQRWSEYDEVSFALSLAGELQSGFEQCPALTCTVGFDHPELQQFLPAFEADAVRQREALLQILRESRNDVDRGNAVYLLAFAFADDPTGYVRAIAPAIRDPSSLVRNNALRTLGDIRHSHPEVELPVEAIIEALHYPSATDRNKAGWLLTGIARDSDRQHEQILEALPVLLDMLQLEQPNNHEPAYAVLTEISGEQYAARDYTAWQQWAARYQ